MKKIKKHKNILIGIIFFIVGFIVALALGYSATILFDSKDVKYDNATGLSSTNVQDALDELYSLCTPFKVGDYIQMTPSKSTYTIPKSLTGYTSNQSITPNELDLWRVINIDNCNVEAVSEYVSTDKVYFSQRADYTTGNTVGVVGYANFVGTLNLIAKQYENPKYTIASRHMGYDGQTEYIADTSAFDGSTNSALSTTLSPSPMTGTGQEYNGGVTGDTLYLKDYQLVRNVYKTDTATYGTYGVAAYNKAGTATEYWLASRSYKYTNEHFFNFDGRSVQSNSYFGYNCTLRNYNDGWRDYSFGYAVRPIITLKSGITTLGGSGTKTSPYTLN